MTYLEALHFIIEDGIEAARADYDRPDQVFHLVGSIKGFEECRNLDPHQLLTLLRKARRQTNAVHFEQPPRADYWFWRCRELEIEWVANVMSALLMNEGRPIIVPPTARGVMKAAEIVGVGA